MLEGYKNHSFADKLAPDSPIASEGKALVIGFLSTFGDLEVLHQVEENLAAHGMAYEIAAFSQKLARNYPDWVDARLVNPLEFSHLIVVCGPFCSDHFKREHDLFARFDHCAWIGVNLSMIERVKDFNPFDFLIERDSERAIRPDLSFLSLPPKVPVVGLCLATHQPEYRGRQQHERAAACLKALIERSGAAVVTLDTRSPLFRKSQGVANASQFESLCARVDVVLTTRLHGTVLALKNGIPVIAVDAIMDGGKLSAQVKLIGWPEIYNASDVTSTILDEALTRCLAPGARAAALQCSQRAASLLDDFKSVFGKALNSKTNRLPMTAKKRLWLSLMTQIILLKRKMKRR